MYLPNWLSNLFGPTPDAAPADISANLDKLAHSELVDNILLDRPLEVVAEEVKSCPECEKPNQFGELCNSCTEAEKVQASESPKVSLVAELEKEAGAYEQGDSETQTANKGHEAQIKAASDYALAEMLTEMHLQGQGVQERWSEEFPKTLKDVQNNRKKAEKEILKSVQPPAVIDRMKFLTEAMDSKFEPTKSENLYGELFDGKGKQTWEKAKDSWKDEALTEKEQYENQMPQETGPGREADDHRGHQAPRSLTASEFLADDIQMLPQDKFLVQYDKMEGGEKYYKWFNTEDAAKHYMESLKETEFAPSAKLKDFSKQFAEKSQETVQKEAAQITHTTPTGWYVTVKLDATDNPETLLTSLKNTVGITEVARYYDHIQLKLGGVGMDEKGAQQVVQNALASIKPTAKSEVTAVSKKADIASPWAVVKKDDKEVIARVTPEELTKKSKEKEHAEVRKSASLDNISTLVDQQLIKIEAKNKLSLTAEEEYEPVQSLEGLEPHEQELWQKHYKLAFQWAMADSIARKIGRSLTRRAAMMALLRVIRTYDPTHESHAKFESYLFRAVHNELLTALKQNKSLREKDPEKFVNIDQPISEGDRMHESETLQDIIEDTQAKLPVQQLEESEQAEMAKEVIKVAQEELKGRQKEIFDLLLQGYNISEIAGLLKFTIPNIVRYRKQLAEQLESILEQVQKTWTRPGVPKHQKEDESVIDSTEVPEDQTTASQEVKAGTKELTNVKLSLGN